MHATEGVACEAGEVGDEEEDEGGDEGEGEEEDEGDVGEEAEEDREGVDDVSGIEVKNES